MNLILKQIKNYGLRNLSLFCFMVLVFGLATPSILAGPKNKEGTVSNSTLRLQQSVHRMNLWLNGSKEAEGWRRFLLLNILETQSSLGERADIATLLKIEARFSNNNNGLSHPAFNDVKIAIREHINQLSKSQLIDLPSAVISARGQYAAISTSQIARQRDIARYELQLLKQYYRQTMPSRKRANLFYDLELDKAIELLGDIEFELAPEISAGKVKSMLRDVENELNNVVEKMDALPATPEPDEDETDENPGAESENQAPVIEPEIFPLDFAPGPDDDEKSLKELQRDRKMLEQRKEIVQKQLDEIEEKDKPRQKRRRKTFQRLQQLEKNFVDLSKTQTDPYFVSAAMSLETFVRTYFYGTSDNLQETFLGRLASLEKDLGQMQGPESRDAAGRVGDALQWMDNANQVSHLVTAIRARYSLPNIYVAVSGKLLNQLGSQSISQTRPIRETLDGRLVRGTGTIQTNVGIELLNDPNQVHANIQLYGTIDSDTYVQQGKLQAYTSATGELEAKRNLYANIGGLFATDAKVAATLRSMFGGTSSRLKLVNKIATKQFEKARAKGEAISARQAQDELEDQFVGQTDEAIKQGQSALSQAQTALASNAQLAPEFYMRSTPTQIVVVGKKASLKTLASPTFPQRSIVPTDVGVRIHESLLSNFFDRTFSNKTFTDKQLAEEMGSLMGGEPPAALVAEDKEGEDGETFSITFAPIRPIQFEFEDNRFSIAISGRRFSQGKRKINAGLRIRLRFKIVRADGKLKMVRDGKAEIDYVDKKDAKTVGFRSFLDGRLNPEEGGEAISIDLPNNLLPIDEVDGLKDSEIARRMQLVQCRSEHGWLYLGWNQQPEFANIPFQIDIPAIWTEAVIMGMEEIYIGRPSQ